MGVRFNSINYSCGYVGNSVSDLLLAEVRRCFAVLDPDVCIGVLFAIWKEKENFPVGACLYIPIFRKNRAGWQAYTNTLYNEKS